ncbi:MAG: hypothetical protein WC656_01265 [Sulfurimonas sp.]|jgi:hypothetical protein
MKITNKDLTVLTEALKNTTAYQNSRGLNAKQDGKIYEVKIGNGEKNELVFGLVQELLCASKKTENQPMNKIFELNCILSLELDKEQKETIYEAEVKMPTL